MCNLCRNPGDCAVPDLIQRHEALFGLVALSTARSRLMGGANSLVVLAILGSNRIDQPTCLGVVFPLKRPPQFEHTGRTISMDSDFRFRVAVIAVGTLPVALMTALILM